MLRFLAAHWWLVLLFPVFVVFATAVHESAHALVVIAQGGTITRFDILPGGEERFSFGRTEYDPGAQSLDILVALAPTAMWTVIAAFTGMIGAFVFGPNAPSKVVLIAGYFLAIVDASLAAAGLFTGSVQSDWYTALHGVEVPVALLFAFYATAFCEVGYLLFQRLWPQALSPAEYTIGYLLVIGLPWLRYLLLP